MSERITYLSEIEKALEQLSGQGSIKEICKIIEENDCLPNIHKNPNWKNNVSTELTTHCKDMNSYRAYNPDLFYSVYGKGEGYWGLKSMRAEYTDEINPIIKRQIEEIRNDKELDNTEKDMLIKARVGQGEFRKRVIEKYKKCLITGIDDQRLLLASHIRPWRASNNHERLSSENGLLLSPLYDKLFDIGLITFSDDMTIIVSKKLSMNNAKLIDLDLTKKYLQDLSDEFLNNLRYHRENIFKD